MVQTPTPFSPFTRLLYTNFYSYASITMPLFFKLFTATTTTWVVYFFCTLLQNILLSAILNGKVSKVWTDTKRKAQK